MSFVASFVPSPKCELTPVAREKERDVEIEDKSTVLRESTTNKATFRHDRGFMGAVQQAYNRHHHLILDPNAVWLTILGQFTVYVNLNAERLRSRLVKHTEGKVQLTVRENANFEALSVAMVDQMGQHLHDENIRDWAVPNFSTTTNTDRATGCIMLMGALQQFMGYKMELCCGLPRVSLTGTIEDWKALYTKASRLREFDLDDKLMTKWTTMLLPVLANFVQTAEGNIDLEWWLKICSHIGGGSGPRYLSGWLTVFSVFDNDQKWCGDNVKTGKGICSPWPIIDTNDLSCGFVECPVTIDDNGKEFKTIFEASVANVDVGSDGTAIQPLSAWRILTPKKPQKGHKSEPLSMPQLMPQKKPGFGRL